MAKTKNEIKFLHDCLLIKDILVIGDIHIGYDEQFHGKAVFPGMQLKEILEKLSEIFNYLENEKIKVKKIILLGDVKHDFGTITDIEWRETLEFFKFLKKKLEEINSNKVNDEFSNKIINDKSNASVFANNQAIKDKISNKIINNKSNVNIINSISAVSFNHEAKLSQDNLSSIKNIKNSLNKNYNKKFNVKNKIIVIKGNHDNILEPIVKKIGIKLVDYYCVNIKSNKKDREFGWRVGERKNRKNGDWVDGNGSGWWAREKKDRNSKNKLNKKIIKICFLHGDRLFKQCLNAQTNVLVFGHLHPAITLYDKYKTEKYKCFLRGEWKIIGEKEVYILPNFSSVSFGYDLRDIDNLNEREGILKLFSKLKDKSNNIKRMVVEKNKTKIYDIKKNKNKFYDVKKDKSKLKKTNGSKEGFFVVPNNILKSFEVIVYNNKEKKEYNFGRLRELV